MIKRLSTGVAIIAFSMALGGTASAGTMQVSGCDMTHNCPDMTHNGTDMTHNGTDMTHNGTDMTYN